MNDAETIHNQTQKIALLEEQLTAAMQQIDWFKRQLFGRKSEKQIEENPYQSTLFHGAEKAEAPPAQAVKAHKRKSQKQSLDTDVNDTGLRFDESVPREVIDIDAPELTGENADQYEIIDYKETSRLAQRPGSYVVLTYRRPVVRHKSTQTLTTPAAPDNVLEGCYADVSVLAGMMVDKAVYHLPLYRQHQRMLDSGVRVSRSTLINWLNKGIELLKPIYQAQAKHVLQSKILAMDEVPMKAGRKGKGKMQQTYFWPIYGDSDEIIFTWSRSRGHAHAVEQLAGFNGTLLTDGYNAYDKALQKLNKEDSQIVHATCWSHARRYFEKSQMMEPEASKQALAIIGSLYKHEEQCRKKSLDGDEVQSYRQKHHEPIVNQFFAWVYEQRQRTDLLPKNPLTKALNYVVEREDKLKIFLCNPNLPLDTNHLERALRVIPMGRKNYLFCWSELGAENLGVLQSLMVTCRLHGINPYTYLVDVLQRVSLHPAKDVEDLTPRVWKERFEGNFLTSDLCKLG